jgi:hypothetical protein
MKSVIIAFLLSAFQLLSLTTLIAQDSTLIVLPEYKNKILFLPAIGSSPETGFLFGAVVVSQFKIGATGPETRSSSVFTSAIYSVKNQILFSVLPDIILPGESWTLNGNYFANYFPESYWGVGASSSETDEVSTLYTQVNLEQNLLRQIEPGLFVGPQVRWSKLYNMSFEDSYGERIAPPDVSGAGGSTTAGIGWITRWDRRNSNMTPTRNHYVQFTIMGNPDWLGSTESYTLYELDARKYLELSGNSRTVLAIQSLFTLHSGNPPFNDLATMGGDRINRGYYSGRYRDQNAGQLQAEFRQHAIGRFGFTVFTATGEVWNRFEHFSLDNYKWTAGAGLRFNINKDDPTNVRIDFGLSKESTGFYLQFGEAF